MGCSKLPVATTTAVARSLYMRLPWMTASQLSENQPLHTAPLSTRIARLASMAATSSPRASAARSDVASNRA